MNWMNRFLLIYLLRFDSSIFLINIFDKTKWFYHDHKQQQQKH